METLNQKKRIVPHTFVIIVGFVIIMAVLTYFIPAGNYERIYDKAINREIVNSSSFTYTERTPVSFLSFLTSFTLGLQSASDIVFFILIIGGAMEILNSTGAVNRGVNTLANKKWVQKLFIPIFAFIFGIGGATFGVSDELVVFAPIGVAVAHALGYDAITGLAAITLGAACGFNSGFLNPFSTSIAQSIAELPLYSGITYRIIVFVVLMIVTIIYISKYAKKVKSDPSLSIVCDCPCELEKNDVDISKAERMNNRDKIVLSVFFGGIAIMVYGVFVKKWFINEMAGIFIAIGIIAGLVGKLNVNEIAETFIKGASSLTFGALVTGIAKAIVIVMQDGQILDTIIHVLSDVILALPTGIAVLGMYIVQIIVNFFIPSSTGQAATIMPIMIPLADIVGVTRQTAVLCFQFGDGFSNSIIPTASVLMSYLAVVRVPYEKWVKFIWPLMLIWIFIGAIFLLIANAISYGPF